MDSKCSAVDTKERNWTIIHKYRFFQLTKGASLCILWWQTI